MEQKQFGLYFAKIREQSGFKSQRQLALISGISNGTIARIESGTQKAQPETLYILSKHLKVTYEELMQVAGYIDQNQDFLKASENEAEYDYQNDGKIPKELKDILDGLKKLSEESQKDFFKTAKLLMEGYKTIEKK